MLNHLIAIVSQLGSWNYLFVFLAVTLESSAFLGFLVPGETFVLFGGFLAAQGTLDLRELMVLVCVGAIIGDSIGYEMGRYVGAQRLLQVSRWFGLRQKHLDQVHRLFERHGGKALFFGRFTALLRALTPFVAGTSGMHYPRFLLYNAGGGIAWGISFVLIGYFVGASWHVVERWISRGSLVVVGLVVLLLVKSWFWRRVARRNLEEV